MRGFYQPTRSMLRLTEAIMIASDAALARHFVPKGAPPRFIPGASRRSAHTRGVAAGVSDGTERTAAGGASPPNPCEASQRSMLRWAPWRMRHGGNPRMRGFLPKTS